jgi:ElaB/YqjD/DUF883 family membrane-anchored ribosome-binding protein
MKTEPTTQGTALAGRDKLSADIAAVAGEAGELLKEYSEEKLLRARHVLTDAQSAVAGRATELRAVAGDYVHAHPWRAVGAAGVAGLVLGLLLARR